MHAAIPAAFAAVFLGGIAAWQLMPASPVAPQPQVSSAGVRDQGEHAEVVGEFLQAAEQGDAESMYMAGRLYEMGVGVGQDAVRAYRWYDRAAALGHQDAKAAREELARILTPEQLAEGPLAEGEGGAEAPAGAPVDGVQPAAAGLVAALPKAPPPAQASPTQPSSSQPSSAAKSMRELVERALAAPKTVAASVNGPSWMDRATIAEVQQSLQDMGFAPGPIDGLVGPRTLNAVRAWQKANDIAQTGRLTPEIAVAIMSRTAPERIASAPPERNSPSPNPQKPANPAPNSANIAIAPAAPQSESAPMDEPVSSILADIQRELGFHGYLDGRATGQMDEKTHRAITLYQRDAKLPVTGLPSENLLDHLQYAWPQVVRGGDGSEE